MCPIQVARINIILTKSMKSPNDFYNIRKLIS